MECGVEIAATEFAPGYRRATIMQASSAALGLLSSIAAWLAGATFWWLVAGALLGSVIPFTRFVILPTNKLLLSPTLDRRSAQTERLLARSLERAAHRKERAQWTGFAAFPALGDLQEASVRSYSLDCAREAASVLPDHEPAYLTAMPRSVYSSSCGSRRQRQTSDLVKPKTSSVKRRAMSTLSQIEILLERAARFDSYIPRNPRGGRDFCPSSTYYEFSQTSPYSAPPH